MFDDDASSSRLQADDMIRTSPRDAVEMNSISALERARADIELMCAAYPDEVRIVSSTSVVASQQQQHCPSFTHQESMIIHTQQQQEQGIPSEFPFFFTLCLKKMNTDTSSSSVSITMELPHGYPQVSLRVVSYRGGNAVSKLFLEQIPSVIHSIAIAHAEKNEECGFILCSHLLEMYNQSWKHDDSVQTQIEVGPLPPLPTLDDVRIHSTPSSSCSKIIPWISGQNTITDRKSVFQAHVCIVQSLEDVQLALSQLKEMNSKIQRATHNMYAYRFTVTQQNGMTFIHHDNDDDGEDCAGSRLAHLLELRHENSVLIVVSRWYGGIQLGPKRFAHITNVARILLEECHSKGILS